MKLITTLAVVVTLTTPVRADLVFKGKVPHKKEFSRIYKDLPEKGKEVDIKVREYDQESWDDAFNTEYVGWYWSSPPVMHVKNTYEVGFIFTHEFGHHVYFVSFTPDERADWEEFWEQNKNLMPRDYAKSKASEGFAECYAIVYYNRALPWNLKIGKKVGDKIRSYFGNGAVSENRTFRRGGEVCRGSCSGGPKLRVLHRSQQRDHPLTHSRFSNEKFCPSP